VFELRTLSEPIVQAPMAGGPSTPELAIAVCQAGGLGFLAAGYRQADAVRREIEIVRAATARPFGVNLFVPTPQPADRESVRDYLRELEPEATRQGVELGEPRYDDRDWERKLQLVCDEGVGVAGRLARGMVNRFLTEHSATAPLAYPQIHHATSPLRAAARERGDADARSVLREIGQICP
jgi:NAD(P)H-dependent flavin oxidoreductase YrpB (nitropropane dioxygenase family)